MFYLRRKHLRLRGEEGLSVEEMPFKYVILYLLMISLLEIEFFIIVIWAFTNWKIRKKRKERGLYLGGVEE